MGWIISMGEHYPPIPIPMGLKLLILTPLFAGFGMTVVAIPGDDDEKLGRIFSTLEKQKSAPLLKKLD